MVVGGGGGGGFPIFPTELVENFMKLSFYMKKSPSRAPRKAVFNAISSRFNRNFDNAQTETSKKQARAKIPPPMLFKKIRIQIWIHGMEMLDNLARIKIK